MKSEKISEHLVINISKMILTLAGTKISGLSLVVTLDDHVAHDHTSMHHIPYVVLRPGKSIGTNNRKSRPEHTKCSLDMLPATLLTLKKVEILLI
jgi:hypothetical protein